MIENGREPRFAFRFNFAVRFWNAATTGGPSTGLHEVGPSALIKRGEALELGVLVTVGRVEVNVQPLLPGRGRAHGPQDQGGLQPAESFGRPDLDRAVLVAEHDEAEHLALEVRQPLGIAAVDDKLRESRSHW